MSLQATEGSKPSAFGEKVKAVPMSALDKLSDRVDAQTGGFEIHKDRVRAYSALRELVQQNSFGYWVMLKYLKDMAKQALHTQGTILPGMASETVMQHLMYYAGAWQALTAAAQALELDRIEETLKELGNERR